MRFPRSGCQTCRDRRIKCDETQPVCQKCVKSRRTCYGMRTGGEIHIENAYASGQQKRPRGPRPASTQNPERAISGIKPPPAPDLKSTAIIFYVNSYMQTLQDSPDLSKGTIDAVFPVFKARPDTPMLSLAISSMALAVFSRTHHCHPAAVAASNQYSQLLKLSSKTVLSITSENVDDCLFAIFFMGRYEDAVHQVQDTGLDPLDIRNPLKSFSHHAGASAVLKIWKERLSPTHQATETIKYTRRGLIRSAFMRGLAIPEFMADGALYGERGLELEYDHILVQMASIRWRTSLLANADSDTVNASSELRAIADRLCRDTLQLDDAMEEWAGSFDIHWRYERHTLPSTQLWPTEDFFTNEILTYRNPYFAAIWNQYYSTRMLLNSLRLRILKVSGLSEDESTFGQRLACISKIKAMANDMAASLPYCLEKLKITDTLEAPYRKVFALNSSEGVKPYISTLIVWPLGIAARVADLDIKQKVWFRSVLTRVGSKLGYGVLQCPQDKYWVDF